MEERVTHNVRPIGKTFHYQKRKYHIVGFTIDRDTDIPVYLVRYYGKHHRWWHYEAMTAEEYDLNVEYNLLKED